jgi:hypothetical protein
LPHTHIPPELPREDAQVKGIETDNKYHIEENAKTEEENGHKNEGVDVDHVKKHRIPKNIERQRKGY